MRLHNPAASGRADCKEFQVLFFFFMDSTEILAAGHNDVIFFILKPLNVPSTAVYGPQKIVSRAVGSSSSSNLQMFNSNFVHLNLTLKRKKFITKITFLTTIIHIL